MHIYQPPYHLNDAMLALVAEIAVLLGDWQRQSGAALVPQLRRGNRIRTIQASLAIEQNTLTLAQVTAVLDGKPVIGQPREILEVRNAFRAYEGLSKWQPEKLPHLLAAHARMMAGLADDAGQLRQQGVGVYRGKKLVHMAPPPSQVPRLMQDLLAWLKRTKAHPLIASCAFHYELAFIHPFSDGNGRICRLWQTLILSHWQPTLAYLPVESVIKTRQAKYYQALAKSDAASDCSSFVEFMLSTIKSALQQAVSHETTQEIKHLTTQETTREKLLQLLREAPQFNRDQLAAQLSISANGVKYHLQKLKAEGRIVRVGSTKSGAWQVVN